MTITYLLGFLQSAGVTNEFESFEQVNRNFDKEAIYIGYLPEVLEQSNIRSSSYYADTLRERH
jgi:hypothetical protein